MENPFDMWTNWVARTGTTIITAGSGVAFLAKSLLVFDINIAAVGVVLTVAGTFIQYLTWSKQIAFDIAKLGIKSTPPR